MASDDCGNMGSIQRRRVGVDKIRRKIIEHTIGASIGIVLFAFLLSVFRYNAPVVALMKAELVARSPQSITVSVTGYKIRSCELVSESFVGWYKNKQGAWAEANGRVSFPNDTSKNSNRPAGVFSQQNFGLFKLNGVPEYSRKIRVTANHLCESDDAPRVTVIGPWNVGAIK